MKKAEKLVSALLTIALGILLIVLQGKVVSILMTVAGVVCITLGIMDLLDKAIPPAVVKLVIGTIVIICGWAIVEAVLYVVAAILLIAGILLLYEKIKKKVVCSTVWQTLCEYAAPTISLVIGTLLLFNQGNTVNWVFIVSGIFTVFEGAVLFVNGFFED